jgi:deazaflavin-dependent oxidoreductase (nitroreductase family)
MAPLDPRIEASLRDGFRYLNRFMLLLWRLGIGPYAGFWPKYTGQFMVINHTGRKSGLRRQTPVNYAIVDGELYCTAGFGAISDWYRNIMAHPQVEVWLADGRWSGVAEDVSDSPNRLRLLRAVLRGSGFAAKLFGVDPDALSDEALDNASHSYRLIHIRRTGGVAGPGGPGDLVWVWPLVVMILLPLALRRRCR